MSGWDLRPISDEIRRLIVMSRADDSLRSELRGLAEMMLAGTDEDPPPSRPLPSPEAVPDEPPLPVHGPAKPVPVSSVTPVLDPPAVTSIRMGPVAPREPLRELTLGRRPAAPPPVPAATASRFLSDDDEAEGIIARCRAKAEAVRWHVEGHRRLWEGVDVPVEEPALDPEMIYWGGRLMDCFYWLEEENPSQSADLSLLDDVAGCYDTIADAVGLSTGHALTRGEIERALPLLAEAQSMLRRALQRLRAPDDADQLAVHRRIREAAARHRIYVKRHMRADDLADPTGWPTLAARIDSITASGEQSRQQKARIQLLRGHLERTRADAAADQEWQAVVDVIEEMVADGVPPSNREVRDLILPVVDDLPDAVVLKPGFQLVLREIDRFLSHRPTASKAAASPAPAAEVKEAARLLEGRTIALIGGARRREAQATLRRALALKDVIWIETKEHQSIDTFEPVIARAEVALVLLAIRWSSHSFGEVRQFCVRHNKPLVRLPGGYGLHQVAAQILSQCSELLENQ